MSELRLRLDVKDLHGAPDEFGVVANIYEVSAASEKEHRSAADRKRMRNLVIPAGLPWDDRPSYRNIRLEPGRYLVEAILPSAEVISEEVTIEESQEPQELRLRGAESPHEWLAWQHFVGNVQQETQDYESRALSFEPKAAIDVRTEIVSALTPPEGLQASEISTSGALVSRGFFFAIASAKDIDATSPLLDFFPLTEANPPAYLTGPLNPYASDSISQVYELEVDSLKQIHGWSGTWLGDYRNERFERNYLFLRGEGIPSQYTVLPVPWMQVSDREATVDALVRRPTVDPAASPGADQGFRTSLTVRDNLLGSVIGYLGAGDLPAAATIVTTARNMLFHKATNPLAAAAGAYVLLSTEESTPGEQLYWHRWIRNLRNGFGWLPDGAILYAWLKLSQARNEENLGEARASLLEGYRRGLPFYSKGVRLMLDGLTLFANDARAQGEPDQEVEAALSTVRRLARRTNARQPFTTVLLR